MMSAKMVCLATCIWQQSLPSVCNEVKNALVQEAMRCLPVASTGVTRKTKRALQLGEYTLPAGSLVVTPFFAAHHWEGNWPEQPDVFNPVRFPHRCPGCCCLRVQSSVLQQ